MDHPSVENAGECVVVQKAACVDLRNTEALPHLILYPPTTSVISVPLTSALRPFCYISFTLKTVVWFKSFSLNLQILSAYQSSARDTHCALPCLPRVYHTEIAWMGCYWAWEILGRNTCLDATSRRRWLQSFLFSPMRIFTWKLFIKSSIFYYINKQQITHHWLPSSYFNNTSSDLGKHKWS